eukprot:11330223-Alexandrium_andersonii.AAC.1
MSTASGARSRRNPAAVAKGPHIPAHSSATAGVCPDPAPRRLPVPAQRCSSVPLAWLTATFQGKAA